MTNENQPLNAADLSCDISIVVNQIQILLAEKRTSLSVMRTGIAVLALPLSVMSVLIATSRYYDITKVSHLLIPVLSVNIGLVVLAIYLIHRSVLKLRRLDKQINAIKKRCTSIAELDF